MPAGIQIVILPQSGEDARTQRSTAITGVPTGDSVAKILRKKKAAELIGTWKQKAGGAIQLWGWRDGKAGTENKHELPPPHDEVLLFGDAVIALVTGGSAVDFTAEAWAIFYDDAFGGFEELGDKDSEDEGVDEEDEEDDVEAEEDEADADEDESEVDEDEDEDEVEEEEEDEAEGADGDCYEEGDEGGGGKRRSVRRRTAADSEYRRIELGLRARVKIPTPPGKRAPRWLSAPELEVETYA
jgi:hypothetical protein